MKDYNQDIKQLLKKHEAKNDEWVKEQGGDTDDAGAYPWDDDLGFRAESKGCTIDDDSDQFINWMDVI